MSASHAHAMPWRRGSNEGCEHLGQDVQSSLSVMEKSINHAPVRCQHIKYPRDARLVEEKARSYYEDHHEFFTAISHVRQVGRRIS